MEENKTQTDKGKSRQISRAITIEAQARPPSHSLGGSQGVAGKSCAESWLRHTGGSHCSVRKTLRLDVSSRMVASVLYSLKGKTNAAATPRRLDL